MSHDTSCYVPIPHEHRPPTIREVEDSLQTITVQHPKWCAWRSDIYNGCSCGVTALVMELYTLHAVVDPAEPVT